MAREAAAAAVKAAEDATALAEGALPKALVRKILGSGAFIAFVIVTIISAVFASVAISIGLSFIGR